MIESEYKLLKVKRDRYSLKYTTEIKSRVLSSTRQTTTHPKPILEREPNDTFSSSGQRQNTLINLKIISVLNNVFKYEQESHVLPTEKR